MNVKLTYGVGFIALAIVGVWSQWEKPSVAPAQLSDTKLVGKQEKIEPSLTVANTNPVKTEKTSGAQKTDNMQEKIVHNFVGGTEFAKKETINETPVSQDVINEKEQARQHSAKMELDQRINQLIESKPGGEQWHSQLSQLQAGWKDLAREMGMPIGFAEVDCYNAGCAAKMTFDQQTDIRQFMMKALSTKTSGQWSGDTYLSGAVEVQAGIFESTWIFTPSLTMPPPDGV